MNIREIKAFVHRNRIADVVSALSSAGFRILREVNEARTVSAVAADGY